MANGLTVPRLATAAEAAARLTAELVPLLALDVTVRGAGKRFVFGGAKANAKLNVTKTVAAALAVAVQPEAPQSGGVPVGANVAPVVTHARIPVKAFAAEVAAGVYRAGRDAAVRIGLRKMQIRRARPGVGVDAEQLAAKLDAVLDDPGAARFVSQRVARVYPAVNVDDLRAQYRTVVTVDKANFKLRLFKNLKLRKTYPIAVGQPAYPTPTGRFSITNKAVNPVWSVPNSPWAGELGGTTVSGGSAANPLKARWMGITNGIGIHGTGQEYSIGSRASHGCIRMRVADVKDLYPRVPVGATVLIR